MHEFHFFMQDLHSLPWDTSPYISKHYENFPVQYTEILKLLKVKTLLEHFDSFNIFAQNIDCGYTLEPRVPIIYVLERRNRCTSVNNSFAIKSGV